MLEEDYQYRSVGNGFEMERNYLAKWYTKKIQTFGDSPQTWYPIHPATTEGLIK